MNGRIIRDDDESADLTAVHSRSVAPDRVPFNNEGALRPEGASFLADHGLRLRLRDNAFMAVQRVVESLAWNRCWWRQKRTWWAARRSATLVSSAVGDGLGAPRSILLMTNRCDTAAVECVPGR